MAKSVYAILGLFLITLAVLQNLLWLAALFALFFTRFFGAMWLMPIAILIDGYFNAFASVPFFSLIAVGWYVLSELLTLRMRIMR